MPAKNNEKYKIISSYLDKYPDDPILTVAKRIYTKYSHVFESVSAVRSVIRYYKGQIKHKGIYGPVETKYIKPLTYKYNAFDDIPESFANQPSFFQLPTGITKLLTLSDIHFPYHDPGALKVAIKKGQTEKVDAILLNGDILDFYQLSSFSKDPSKPTMQTELEQGRWFMGALRKTFPKAVIYYKLGNHEERLERWLKLKAPEWIDTDEFKINVLLQFGKHKIQLIESQTVIQRGTLNIIHGHEYKGAGGVNPARGLFLKTKLNTICGHYHRKSEYIAKNIKEEVNGAWTTGCLCELNPDYMPKGNDWVHGFAIVSFDKSNNYTVNNYCIVNNKII